MAQYPGASFILEWENAKLSEAERARQMLRGLSKQMAEIGDEFSEKPEVIITFDPDAMSADFIQSMFDGAWNSAADVDLQITSAANMEYYGQKNFGAKMATRPWLVFVDSDVVPEANWLKRLLEARRNSNAAIVGGQTYVEPAGLVDRAFALFWFFPLRSEDTKPYDSEDFYANNFAVERQYFLDHPFPECDLVRGRCCLLAKDIRDAGERVEINPSARVGHPPPNGTIHFFKRALIAGYDFRLMDKMVGPAIKNRAPFFMALSRAKWNLQASFRKIGKDGKKLGLGFGERLVARNLAVAYYGLAAIGEITSCFAPSFVRKNFSV